ncbi:MAG TPA: glutamate--tRNA ligase [Anaerolineaceae bacterium]
MDIVKPARVRFAPSPTGHLHLGGARTALYDYLLAKKTGGQFVLRIEDTDQKRLVPGSEAEIMHGLRWLGIPYDEGPDIGGRYGPYRQSERRDIYAEYTRRLIDSGHAYYCFCTPDRLERVRQDQQKQKISPHYDGTCRRLDVDEARRRVINGERHVVRFKTPKEGTTTCYDLLRGKIHVENQNIDDYILVKSDGLPVYHLAATVDDHEMEITHVIRGSEWLPTFPLHTLITRALGWEELQYVHLSVFLKPSGKGKMSKREAADLMKDGYSIFIKDMELLGYLPEAVVNWIALMGWSYDDHTEFFTMPDLVDKFSLDRLNPSPAAINFTKFDYFNAVHIRNLDIDELARRLLPYFESAGVAVSFDKLRQIVPIIRERITTLDEAPEMTAYLFKDTVDPDPEALIPKGMTSRQASEIIQHSLGIFEEMDRINLETAEPIIRELGEKLGFTASQTFWVLRVAITGQKVSPPLFESMEILGKESSILRLRKALQKLDEV